MGPVPRSFRHRFLIAILLLAAGTALRAQEGDVRISNNDRGHRMLPAAAIQRASARGEYTAVVWGTTIVDERSTLRLAFHAQLLRSGVPVGRAWPVGSIRTHAGPKVQIAPCADGFLISYVDLAPNWQIGTYAQILKPSGDTSLLSRATLLLTNGVDLDSIGGFVLKNAGRGWYMFWRNRGELWRRPLDKDWLADSSPQLIAQPGWTVVGFPDAPTLRLIEYPKGIGRVFDENLGDFDSRTVVPLGESYCFGSDGTVLTIGDSVLTQYRSLFDSTILWQRALPELRRDVANDNIVVREGSSVSIVSASGRIVKGAAEAVLLRYRFEFPDGPVRVDTALVIRDTVPPRPMPYYRGSSRSAGWGGPWTSTVVLFNEYNQPRSFFFSVDPDGDVRLVPGPGLRSFDDAHFVDVVRFRSDDSSVVGLPRGGDTLTLSLPVAVRTPAVHYRPGIVALDSAMVCTWMEADTVVSGRMAAWRGGNVERDRPPLVPAPLSASLPYEAVDIRISASSTTESWSLYGDVVFSCRADWVATYRVRVDNHGGLVERQTARRRIALARPTTNGWELLDSILDPVSVTGWLAGADMDRSMLFALNSNTSSSVVGANRTGRRWSTPFPAEMPVGGTMLPMRDRRGLVVGINRVALYDGGDRVGVFEAPNVGGPGRRLVGVTGMRWLQLSWTGTDSTELLLEQFGERADLLERTTVKFERRNDDFGMAQRHRDSLLVLVFSGPTGVRALGFDARLQLVADTIVSAWRDTVWSPAAAFDADTLVAVWVDRRDGYPRVFGSRTALAVKRSSDSSGWENVLPATARAIEPNPTTGAVSLCFDAPVDSRCRVDIIDGLGSVRYSQEYLIDGPTIRIGLDLSGSPPGVYTVRLRHDRGVSIGRVVKVEG